MIKLNGNEEDYSRGGRAARVNIWSIVSTAAVADPLRISGILIPVCGGVCCRPRLTGAALTLHVCFLVRSLGAWGDPSVSPPQDMVRRCLPQRCTTGREHAPLVLLLVLMQQIYPVNYTRCVGEIR